MFTTSFWICTIIHPCFFKSLGLYLKFCQYSLSLFFFQYFELETRIDPGYGEPMICKTELRKNSLYSAIYVFWSKVIFKELIPYSLLISLNGCIIHAIFKSQSLRKKHSAIPIKKLSVRSISVKPVKKGIHFDYSRIPNKQWHFLKVRRAKGP